MATASGLSARVVAKTHLNLTVLPVTVRASNARPVPAPCQPDPQVGRKPSAAPKAYERFPVPLFFEPGQIT